MQYTKTAGIAAAAGLFLLAFSMTMKDSKKGLFVLSVFLVCAGVMYRPMEAFACLLICGGAFLVVFFKKQINIRKILIPVVMISVLLIVDKAAYGLDDGWKEWKRYNEVRSDLLDYGLPDYQSHEQVLNDAGITRSAFDLLASWNFADPDVLTAEKLEIIQSLKEPRPFINGDLVRAYFKTVSPGLFRYLTFYPLLLIAVLAFAGRKRLKDFLFVLFWVLVTFNGVYYFLFANGRYLMRRVDTGLFFAAAMAFLFLVHNKSLNKGTAVISLAVMAVTGSVYAFNGPTAYLRGGAAVRQLNDLTAASREVLDETTGDKEHLYLVQMGALSDSLSFRIFESPGPGELDNVIWLGGWDIYTPSWHEAKQAFGVSNPYRDCIDRDDILIVAGNTDLLLRYFHDYYGGDIEMVPDHNVGNAVAYHVIRTQK